MQCVFSQIDSIQSVKINNVTGVFVPYAYIPVINTIIVERDIFKQANDTLHSIVSNQNLLYKESEKAILSLKNQNSLLQAINGEYIGLVSVCEEENKKLHKKIKRQKIFTKAIAGIAGGTIFYMVVKKEK